MEIVKMHHPHQAAAAAATAVMVSSSGSGVKRISFMNVFATTREVTFPLRAIRTLAFAISSLASFIPVWKLYLPGYWLPKVSLDLRYRFFTTQAKSSASSNPLQSASVKAHNEENDPLVRRSLAQIAQALCAETLVTERRVCSFVNSRKQTMFTQSWIPASAENMKGLVILLHGLNEHSGRYAYFASQLNVEGYGVFGMDWIGHGGSDGLHGYVESLDHVVQDTLMGIDHSVSREVLPLYVTNISRPMSPKSFCSKPLTLELLMNAWKLYKWYMLTLMHGFRFAIQNFYMKQVIRKYPGLPVFLFGHSTGGAIALKTTFMAGEDTMLKGVVLTSPAVRVKPAHPLVAALAPIFSFLLPRYQFKGAARSGVTVSRDPLALAAKYSDRLVYTGPVRIRTGTEILRLGAFLTKNLEKVTTPFLVMHGSQDQVTDPDGSRELFTRASSLHKNIQIYDGLLHDLLFEYEKDEIIRDIIQWLDSRVQQ